MIIDRLRALRAEIPEAILLSIMTAISTLVLILVVSAVMGTENNYHRISSRCFAHDTTALLREIVLVNPQYRERIDLSKYPPVDITGIDCQSIFESLEGP